MNSSRNTHPLNVSYLVVGLVFLGVAGSWALRESGLIDLSELRWLFPATLVAAGLIGVIAMAAKGLSRQEDPHGHDLGGHETYEHDYEGEAR